MAGGCRDCKTCTQPGLLRMMQNLACGMMHLTIISFMIKRGFMRHCPQCKHLKSRHEYRADGSYKD